MEKNSENDIILGSQYSDARRFIAFGAILIIYFFYCYNFTIGIFVRPTMVKEISDGGFGFTLQQASSIFGILSFATIPGTLIFGMLSTKIGKKLTLMCVAAVIATMTFLPLLDPTSITLWRIARFGAGLGLGAVFGTAQPLVMEMFASKYRGKLAAILTTTFSLAMILGGQLYASLGDENWRILVMTAVIPHIIGIILVFFFVPEDKELTQKRAKEAQENRGEKINYLSMYKGKYLFIGIGVIILSGMNFTAYSAFGNNATTYLTGTLAISAKDAGWIFSLQGVGQLIGYNVWGLVSDKWGRKMPSFAMLMCALLVFVFTKLGSEQVTAFMLLATCFGFFAGFSGAWGAYYTELFPKRFSGLAAGISFNGGRLISSPALPLTAGIAATSFGIQGVFVASSAFFVIGFLIWRFLPETLGANQED